MTETGERVWRFGPFKQRAKLEPRWRNGIYLGRAWGSDQNYFGLFDGSVAKARALVRAVPDIRWDMSRIKNISGSLIDRRATTVQDTIEDSTDPHAGPPGQRTDGVDVDDLHHGSPKRVPSLSRDLVKF